MTRPLAFLFVAGLATLAAGCGGSDPSPVSAPSAARPPSPPAPPPPPPAPPPPPPPAPAPVSTAPYFLLGEAGRAARSSIRFAPGVESQLPTQALVLVDPARPTSPVQLEEPGTWFPIGSVLDRWTPNDDVRRTFERYRIYAKDDRFWRVDLAKTSDQTPTMLGTQRLSGEDGVCAFVPRVFQSQPAAASHIVFHSPDRDGNCHTFGAVSKTLRVDASPAQAPTVVDGQVITAIYDASGAIDGWIVRKGTTLVRQSVSFDNPSPALLAEVDQDVHLVVSGGNGLPGYLFASRTSDGITRLLAFNLATGASKWLEEFRSGWIEGIGADSSHLYFFAVAEGPSGETLQIRRVDYTAAAPSELIVQEKARAWPYKAFITQDRIIYDGYDWDLPMYLRSIPKSATNVFVDDPATGPQPTELVPLSDVHGLGDWGAGPDFVWRTVFASARTTSVVSEDGASTFVSRRGGKAGELRGPNGEVAAVLIGEYAPEGGALISTLGLYDGSDGSLKVSYGWLPAAERVAYLHPGTTLYGYDAPALVSLTSLLTPGDPVTDLYFINGMNPGVTRVTQHAASAAPLAVRASAATGPAPVRAVARARASGR